jgi:hypothetical protein
MGADPKTFALKGFCQAHDVKNLFVTVGLKICTSATPISANFLAARRSRKYSRLSRNVQELKSCQI